VIFKSSLVLGALPPHVFFLFGMWVSRNITAAESPTRVSY